MISKSKLEEFKQIYKEEFNLELSDQEALEKATSLLNLYKMIYIKAENPSQKENDMYNTNGEEQK